MVSVGRIYEAVPDFSHESSYHVLPPTWNNNAAFLLADQKPVFKDIYRRLYQLSAKCVSDILTLSAHPWCTRFADGDVRVFLITNMSCSSKWREHGWDKGRESQVGSLTGLWKHFCFLCVSQAAIGLWVHSTRILAASWVLPDLCVAVSWSSLLFVFIN